MGKIWSLIIAVPLAIIIGMCWSFLMAFLVMWLWNWLMPIIFDLFMINYWQAWGLLVLSNLLIKGSNK